MINRENWKLVKSYLTYRQETGDLKRESLDQYKKRLRHVLEWADETSFIDAGSIRPTLRDYLENTQAQNDEKPLSRAYKKKIIAAAHQFGIWLSTHQTGYRGALIHWLDTLKSSRTPVFRIGQHEAVSLEEIQAIAAAPAEALWQKRIRAAAVFWFLSGIRIGAFVTLPIRAVDISSRKVCQWPELGVNTKFSKHSTTYLLDIPDLLTVVKEWDGLVRQNLPENGYWFAQLSTIDGDIEPEFHTAGRHRHARARKDLRRWLNEVGLPYHSPHKFRHGFAVHTLKLAQDMADYKAISMNLMHENMSITDGIYAILSEQDVSERISTLGDKDKSPDELIQLLRQVAKRLEGKD